MTAAVIYELPILILVLLLGLVYHKICCLGKNYFLFCCYRTYKYIQNFRYSGECRWCFATWQQRGRKVPQTLSCIVFELRDWIFCRWRDTVYINSFKKVFSWDSHSPFGDRKWVVLLPIRSAAFYRWLCAWFIGLITSRGGAGDEVGVPWWMLWMYGYEQWLWGHYLMILIW